MGPRPKWRARPWRRKQDRAPSSHLDCGVVSAEEVDEYLRGVEEPKRSVLQMLRRTILEVVPEAEQVISYGVPAFRVGGETVAGFAAFKTHLSYLPFSGSVLGRLADELAGYKMTKSSLHFPVDRPLPKGLVKKLIALRLVDARPVEAPQPPNSRRGALRAGQRRPPRPRRR
jgi:uncharacterized protein YdhG (YjbR/CyaY superfamily)